MKYDVEEQKEQIDVMILSQKEYDTLNAIFDEGVKKHGGGSSFYGGDSKVDLKKIILTDGYHRVECIVKIA